MSTRRLTPSRRELLTTYGPAATMMWAVLQAHRSEAQTTVPKRFVTFFVANGVLQESFWPKGTFGTAASRAYSFDGTSLFALGGLTPDLTIVKGVTIDRGPGDAHDAGSVALMTGDYLKNDQVNNRPFAYGQSLDRFLADTLSKERPEPMLLQAARLQSHRISKYVSFDVQGQPLEPVQDPYAVYDRLLRSLVIDCSGGMRPTAEAQRLEELRFRRFSVLDAIRPQIESMRQRVSLNGVERQKLERMEDSVRSVERRLEAMAPSAPRTSLLCTQVKGAMEAVPPFENNNVNYPHLVRLHLDLLALCLELDITRVATINLCQGGGGGVPMSWLRWDNNGSMQSIDETHHSITHGSRSGVENHPAKLRVIDAWNVTQFAHLVSTLKGINEGGSSVLDNSIVWLSSDVGEGYTHTAGNLPVVIAGRAGGTLQTGRYLQVNNARHQRLLLSFLQKLGMDTPSWGRAGSTYGGPIL